MFELTILLVNVFLMALYVMVVHPFLPISYRGTTNATDIDKYYKNLNLKLLIAWGTIVVLFATVIYTESTYLPVFITATLLYMYFATIRGIIHHRKYKKNSHSQEVTKGMVTDLPTPIPERV